MNASSLTMSVPPFSSEPRFVFSAAGFMATRTFGRSPGVVISRDAKWIWNADTPASVPAGARISAGKSGRVAKSLPRMAVALVNRSPVSCMPSPESPAKRTTTRSRSSTVFGLMVHCGPLFERALPPIHDGTASGSHSGSRRSMAPVSPREAPPLPALDLDVVLAPFGESRGLPAVAYLSDEVFEWELRHLFEASWTCVGRAGDIAEPGSRRAVEAGAEPVLLVRGGDGLLRAFSDVCRHRGHLLAEPGEPSSGGKAIVCPYHGWTYALDGSVLGAPSMRDVPEFDPAAHALPEVPVREWAGFAMVNVSGDGPPLADQLGSLVETVAQWDVAGLRAGAREEYEVAANWKTISENYHECDHCSNIHPALSRCPRCPAISTGRSCTSRWRRTSCSACIPTTCSPTGWSRWHRGGPAWSASGCSARRSWTARGSTPPTPSSSGTGPTARTGG